MEMFILSEERMLSLFRDFSGSVLLYSICAGVGDTAKYVNMKVVPYENGVGVGEIFPLVWYASLF
jgi:hypothetical protein